ncbi:MAG: GNAT family N-acetyltransferase [Thalassobaculales bacterium]
MAEIETARLALRPYGPGDVAALHAIIGDPVTMRHYPWPFSEAEARAWVERSMQRWAEQRVGRMVVMLKETGEMVGDCGLVPTEIDGESATDIAWIIDRRHWRRGYAREAAAALRDRWAARGDLPPLRAHMAFDNTASRRTAEAIGLVFLRSYYYRRNRGIRHLVYGPPAA